jgi:hypothetical protein
VYERESSEWAAEIVRDIVQREGITRQQVTLHSDNGGPMKGATTPYVRITVASNFHYLMIRGTALEKEDLLYESFPSTGVGESL